MGKTIQAIAATEILARHFGVSKVLVICPTLAQIPMAKRNFPFRGGVRVKMRRA